MATQFAQAGVEFITKGVNNFIKDFDRANSAVRDFTSKISKSASDANAAISKLGNAKIPKLDDLNKPFESLVRQADHLTNSVLPALTLAAGAAAVAIAGIFGAGAKTAVSFESSFADVTKTVDAFIDRSETARVGVIQLTEEGSKFRETLKDLTEEIPATFEELSALAGLGGQLGIIEGLAPEESRRVLESFVKTVAGLGEATDVPAQKAALSLSQISNIFRESIDDIGLNIERLGATVVELGNTSATTERVILNFAERIAGAGQTVGLTQADVLGLSAAFASIGITPEAGATSVNRALLIINQAVAESTGVFADNTKAIDETMAEISDLQADLVRLEYQTGITGRSLIDQRDAFLEAGGAAQDFGRQLGDARREQLFKTQTAIDQLTKKLQELSTTQGTAVRTEVFDELLRVINQTAKGADLTADALSEMFGDAPAEVFALFVEGLAEDGDRAAETLDRLGLGSVEATRAFLAIAGASGTVRETVENAAAAFEANTAAVDEVSVRYATLQSRIKTFISTLRNVGDDIFNPFLGGLANIIDEAGKVANIFGEKLPAVIQALSNKFVPELQEVFNELFGPGIFGGDEITTPEGFVVSGDAIGVQSALVTGLTEDFDNLIETINSLNVDSLSDQVARVRDTIAPIWNGAITLMSENTELFIGLVKGLATVVGGTLLISAFAKAGAAIGFLLTPLGTLSLVTVGLSIAWETNFLNIQETTKTAVDNIKSSLSELVDSIEGIDLRGLFAKVTGGAEEITPEGFVVSGEAIGLEPGFFDKLNEAAGKSLEVIGNLTSLVIAVPVDQISGLIQMFNGLVQIVDALDDSSLRLSQSLGGVQQVIEGFVNTAFAPIQNLLEMFGVDFDPTVISDAIFDQVLNFVQGFVKGFTGTDLGQVGESFNELLESLMPVASNFVEALSSLTAVVPPFVDALGDLFEAISQLVGIDPNFSVVEFLGMITGFLAGTAVDQLIAVIEGLTGLVQVITGLITLDYDTAIEGISGFGTALQNFLLAPLQNVWDTFSEDTQLGMAQAALDGLAAFEEAWTSGSVGLVSLIGQSGIEAAEAWDQAWAGGTEIFKNMWEFVTTVPEQIKTAFNNILSQVTLGMPLSTEFTEFLFTAPSQVQTAFANVLSQVDLGLPSFSDIIDRAKDVAQQIKDFFLGLFEGIDLGIPDFGITEALEDLGLITPDVDTTGIGTDLTSGIINEVEAAEEDWVQAWTDWLLSPIEAGKEALGIQSPSTVTQEFGQDVIAGYALGLSDLTAIEQALIPIETQVLETFRLVHTQIMDDLIPVKLDLAETNEELTPTVDALTEAENSLADSLGGVFNNMSKVRDISKDAKNKAKDLRGEIDLLAKAYENLASAVKSASDAGDGLQSPPSAPTTTPGVPFQTGGSFVVPSNVGTEGLPIRVHAGEYVQIIPANVARNFMPSVPAPSSLPSPRVSGATINNMTSNSVSNTDNKEFHLHVQEAVSADTRDSFELLEALS